MEPDEEESIVRVWRGLDPLAAQFLQYSLLDHGIDCYLDRDLRRLDLGMTDMGLWVAKRDEARARQVIAKREAEMLARLSEGSESHPDE